MHEMTDPRFNGRKVCRDGHWYRVGYVPWRVFGNDLLRAVMDACHALERFYSERDARDRKCLEPDRL